MRDVGTVLSVTPSGRLTVRAPSSEVAPEGTAVRDGRGILRGKVVRVFGPVARPYLSVRPRRTPTPAEGVALLGASLVRDE
jgi:rRNA processing protein Gar1